MMRCLLDMDGVLVDLLPSWLELNGFSMLNPWPDGQYDLSSLYPIDRELIWSKTTEQWWADLPKTPDADRIMEIVKKRFNQVYLVTNPTTTVGATGKILWIEKHYPEYMNRFILGPCRHTLANSETVLIDDHSINVDLFNQYNGRGILLARKWNRKASKSNQTINDLIECLNNTTGLTP